MNWNLTGFSLIVIVVAISAGAYFRKIRTETQPAQLAIQVISTFRHDPQAFTQGLIYHHGSIYESTGLYRRSTLRKLDRAGKVLQKIDLPGEFFGEGLERVQNRLVLITWREGIASVFDLVTFKLQKQFKYEGEGWGLCYDGTSLIMSNGSDVLTYRNPETFEIVRQQRITIAGHSLTKINELEWAEGSIYANVWPTDRIVRIDPPTGRVTAVIYAEGLLNPGERLREQVLNGIAYNPDAKTFFITGKNWPAIFETKFVALASES